MTQVNANTKSINRKLKALPNNMMKRRELLVAMSTKEVERYGNHELLKERRRQQKKNVIQVKRLKDKRDYLKNLKENLQLEIQFLRNVGLSYEVASFPHSFDI